MNLKKRTLLALLAFMGAVPVWADDPIKVGVFAPLTGTVAANGINIRDAVSLYVDELNAKGGVHGRKIELVVEDDRNSPKDAAAVAQKIAGTPGVVLAIGSFTSTPSISAAPVFAEAHIPQIAPTAAHPGYTATSAYQFGSGNLEAYSSQRNANLLVNRLKARKVVIVYTQDDWGLLASKLTGEAVEKLGGNVLLSEAVVPGSKDFRPLVSKIRGLKPEAIFYLIHYTEAAILSQQLHQSGVNVPIAAADQLTNPKIIELAGKDAEGIVIETTFLASNPANREFTEAYTRKTGREPDRIAALAYDSIHVGVLAIQKVLDAHRPLTGQAVRDALAEAAPVKGLTGVTRFDHGRVQKETIPIVIRGGTYQLYTVNH